MTNNFFQSLQSPHDQPLNGQSVNGQVEPHHPRHKILVIDDNLVLRKLIASQLSSDRLEIYEAEDGPTGLAKAAEIQPDLILLDYHMPGMDGYEVYKALKAQEAFAQVPIIVLSSSYNDVAQRFGTLLAPEDFLPKQSSYDELRDRIQAALTKELSPDGTKGNATSITLPIQDVSALMTHLCQMEYHLSETSNALSQEVVEIARPVTNLPQQASSLPKGVEEPEAPYSYATQDLLDALPRVWTRGLLYLVIVFTAIALPLAVLSKADETGTARGRLEPEGQTFKVGAAVSGKVAKVLVREGQQIVKGQPLLELEANQIETELQQVQAKLSGQVSQLGQAQLIKNQIALQVLEQQKQSQTQDLEKQAQVAQSQQILDGKKSTLNNQIGEKQALVDQAQQALSVNQTNLEFVKKQVELDQQELDRYRQAQAQGVVPEITVIEKQKAVAESQRQLAQATSEIRKAQLHLAEQENQYKSSIAQLQDDIGLAKLRVVEVRRNHQGLTHSGTLALRKGEQQLEELQSQIGTLQSDIAQSESQIKALRLQLDQRIVRSPANGTIYKLPIQRTGAVVEPSTLVAEIAPKGTPLVLQAQMSTQESGFLRPNMPVRVKFDAYPFQDYGVIKGKLSHISPNSEVNNTNQGQVTTFAIQVKLQQTCIHSTKECIALNPGQTATAEVVIRQRRVIDFFLDPFKKLQGSGLKL